MWWSLIVPIIAVGLLAWKFRSQLAWWEPAVMLAAPALLIGVVSWSTESIHVTDTEWCTDKTLRVEHYEPYVREWQEWVPARGHTDSKGHYIVDSPGHFETRTEYHPEHWNKVCANGKSYLVAAGEYQRIVSGWGGNEVYTDLYHPNQRHRLFCDGGRGCRCSDGRGDMFHVAWPGNFVTIEPVTWTQWWTNRVQATSETVFRFPEVSNERMEQLFQLPYPDENENTASILGQGGPTQSAGDRLLMQWNAVLGPRPENEYERACRMWIVAFAGSTDDQDARDLEAMWKGGNKNEFTLCVGLDAAQHVTWAYVISWTDAQRLKIDVREWVLREFVKKPVDWCRVADFMGRQCQSGFIRKRSRDWSYLTIQPPTWAVVMCWLLSMAVTGGIGWVVVNNGCKEQTPWRR
jgi:hypothetical protein